MTIWLLCSAAGRGPSVTDEHPATCGCGFRRLSPREILRRAGESARLRDDAASSMQTLTGRVLHSLRHPERSRFSGGARDLACGFTDLSFYWTWGRVAVRARSLDALVKARAFGMTPRRPKATTGRSLALQQFSMHTSGMTLRSGRWPVRRSSTTAHYLCRRRHCR